MASISATQLETERSRVLVPVRYAAWLAGDMGKKLDELLQNALGALDDVAVTRLPRGFLVEAAESPGPLLEATHRAVQDLEAAVRATYPVFHHEMGPVWTGTLQAVFH